MSAGAFSGAIEVPFVPARPAAVAVTGRDRLALLDAVRLAAAAGIVWVHAAQSAAGQALWPLGTFGVPFYTFVAVLFMTRTLTKPGGRSLGEYALSRAGRVYLPFLFWSAVYVMLGEAKSVVQTHTFRWPSPTVLYVGGQQHLWFLPFLMAVTLVGAVLVRGVRAAPEARWPVVTLLVTFGVVAAALPEPAWVGGRGDDLEFWRYSFRASPTVFWALALGLAAAFGGRLPRSGRRTALIGLALFVSVIAVQEASGTQKVLRSLAGLGCVAVALTPAASPTLSRFGRLGRYSYGIYLSHLVFLRVTSDWMDHRGVTPTLGTDAVSFAFAFAAAAGLSVLLSRSAWTRWALGE